MSGSVFLDTSGWLALINASESSHEQARKLWLELMHENRRVVLSDWIIAETGNGLARLQTRKSQFVQIVEEMLGAPSVEVVVVNNPFLLSALADFARYSDKSWGLVDCASFLVMRHRGITEAFTSDRHFEQAGFRCLLTP